MKKKPFRRLIECLHSDETTGGPCGAIHHDLNKFYDHLRTHTKEKPFKCPIEGCDIAFAQKGNLNRHVKSHENKEPSINMGYEDDLDSWYDSKKDLGIGVGYISIILRLLLL